MKRIIITMLFTVILLAGCSTHENQQAQTKSNKGVDTSKIKIKNYNQSNSKLKIDNTRWKYDSKHKVYYQLNVSYVAKPQAKEIEKMGIYVPAAYFNGKKNSNGYYTVSVNKTKKFKNYTAKTAPIVYPVNTPGYAAQSAPGSYSYSSISKYMKSGFIYVQAGLRGRSMSMGDQKSSQQKASYEVGAPWGVTDLKAAIRYYRFNSSDLPGSSSKVYTFGHSGGGAQSSIMGASGDSKLYYKYLKKIGAAMTDKDGKYISDKIDGAMAWCPITSLDQADSAYEWNLGQYSNSSSRKNNTFTGQLSNDLAVSYGEYLNNLKLKNGDETLSLNKTKNGQYTSGSYTKYLKQEVEKSATEFLNNTKFPYNQSDSQQAGMNIPNEAGKQNKKLPQMMNQKESKTYKSRDAYLKELNKNGEWITYNEKTKKAHIKSLKDFAKYYKKPTKSVPAFDDLNKSQAENEVFGTSGSNSKLHFDKTVAQLLKENKTEYSKLNGWKSKYTQAYNNDLTKKDALGSSIATRQNMYNPMYYLSDAYSGYGKSNVANNWRIRTGIQQGDTSLNVETNLALALKEIVGKGHVDFKTIWDKQHTMAETSGDPETNFINWVKKLNKE